jgi:hypothetical protein
VQQLSRLALVVLLAQITSAAVTAITAFLNCSLQRVAVAAVKVLPVLGPTAVLAAAVVAVALLAVQVAQHLPADKVLQALTHHLAQVAAVVVRRRLETLTEQVTVVTG